MWLISDRYALEELPRHATSAAELVGHLDGAISNTLGDHVDAVARRLTEVLGRARVPARRDMTAADDHIAYDGSPMVPSGADGAS